jgi:hypothetical protein
MGEPKMVFGVCFATALLDKMPLNKVILSGVFLMVIVPVLALQNGFCQQDPPNTVTIPLIGLPIVKANDLNSAKGVVVLPFDPAPFDADLFDERLVGPWSGYDTLKAGKKVLSGNALGLRDVIKMGGDHHQKSAPVHKVRSVAYRAAALKDRARARVPVSPLTVSIEREIPFRKLILRAAQAYDMDPALIIAVIKVESNYNPKAVSHCGARGLMQIMPMTARYLKVDDPFDPAENVNGGVRYLRQMLDRFDGDERLALAAYNAGVANVLRYGGVPPFKETREYVKTVLGYRDALQSAGAMVTELSPAVGG